MIRNVVFDVGGVLVRLRYRPFIQYLSEAGVDLSDLPAWLATIDLDAHERGELSAQELMGRIVASAPRPLDPRELERLWLDMFERWGEMFDLATGLMDRYRVYLLSNVGDLHWAHLNTRFGIEQVGHGAIASFRVGATKPSAAIYHEAERRLGLEPAATVFIDDLERNVVGARTCGWNAIHHQSPLETRRGLRGFGVWLPDAFAED